MEIHSNILAWKIHKERSMVGYSPMGHKESETTEDTRVIKIHVYICKLETILNHMVSETNISADTIYRTHLDIDVCTDICQ